MLALVKDAGERNVLESVNCGHACRPISMGHVSETSQAGLASVTGAKARPTKSVRGR